ncbi:MAG: alcohol dehydrogenase catalytic domain-containing protein, partial [Acidothermales bacterium]|nr:alcohol dehydrogenase catalytic domain-containing protein [Acidothermales bacterium]
MILALELYRSLPRYVASRVVTKRLSGVSAGPLTPLRLVTRDEPKLPKSGGWARVRPRLSGICGSDLGALYGSTGLYFSALVSMPFVPGHEVVGDLQDDCGDLPRGTRVVIDPVLTCAARGVELCESCASGRTNLCDRVTVGHVSPGLQTGYCADTGGGWSAQLVAHRSQLHPVPDTLDDRRAVLVEPLACAVHTALRARVPDGASVLVVGSGAVGLFTTLALRELASPGSLTVVAKHPLQRELARRFGATDVLAPSDVIGGVRRATRALRLDPDHDSPFLLGGVDIAVDAAGSAASLRTALRTVRAGGRVVLSAMPPAGADLSPVWFRELEVVGAYASAMRERVDGVER